MIAHLALAFAVGVNVGVGLVRLVTWFRMRGLRRLNEARAKAMAEAIQRFFTEPTPGCDCRACREKRGAAPAPARGAN